MAITLKNHGGYCDFCGSYEGMFAKGSNDKDRDICETCVREAASKFGIKETSTPKLSDMLNALMKRLLDSKTKTLIKAGLLDSNLNLTKEGEDEVNALILQNNIDALVEVANDRIKEKKENK